ncbi:MAG TPA: hypothetical protein PLH09_06940, partial [Lentimicrobium sp.]|nr:hypothetical protein [Lentimicrobium sp.]
MQTAPGQRSKKPSAIDESSGLKGQICLPLLLSHRFQKHSPGDRIITQGTTYNYHYLKPGTWFDPLPLNLLGRGFKTFTLEPYKSARAKLRDTELEMEIIFEGKVLKRFTVAGPDGPTFGVFIPGKAVGE